MKQEYSYGAVVYREVNGQLYYLIENMALGHVSIPKGHIEEGETPRICTLREIKEETNLEVDLDMAFEHVIQYSPKPGVNKTVTFYVAKALTSDIISQPEEVTSCDWLRPEDAIKAVTFQTDKETLEDATRYLRTRTGLS